MVKWVFSILQNTWKYSVYADNRKLDIKFSIKCTIYNYFVLVFNYDRGHFGCNIVCGDDAIALPNDIEWDNDCDFAAFWKNVDEQIRLRIPDKYLQAYGWL